jgi:hypothetical protein
MLRLNQPESAKKGTKRAIKSFRNSPVQCDLILPYSVQAGFMPVGQN